MARALRTTVRLDEQLLRRAKREAAARGETLTALIDRGVRLVVENKPAQTKRQPFQLPVSKAKGGVLPGINLEKTSELLDIMEDWR